MQAGPDLAERLGKLVPRLASDHDGEVVATVAAITRTLKSDGYDLHDLAAVVEAGFRARSAAVTAAAAPARRSRPKPPAPPSRCPQTPFQQAAGEILRVALKRLRKKDNQFLTDLLEWRGKPSPAQLKWLKSLCRKYGVELENG